ncbi:MAG: hypothetical protein CMK32_15495 [Porticoccaceae bacterium]|nr:hypothetical protein [Porticoccaceae bacterium]
MTLDRDAFMRYSRHLLMADVGEQGQETLLESRVLVVGLGGLGCPVALYLTAAGVGHLTLCDPDNVDLTNLQRQILYTEADCGEPKVDCALVALRALNPSVTFNTHCAVVGDSVLPEGGADFDVVIDCTDNLAARHWLNRRCHELGIPLVSAAALGWEGQLMTFDFARGSRPCLACAIPEDAGEPLANCGNSGVIGPVLGVMGSLQAIATLRLLLKGTNGADNEPYRPLLQRFDGRRETWTRFAIRPVSQCPVCGDEQPETHGNDIHQDKNTERKQL